MRDQAIRIADADLLTPQQVASRLSVSVRTLGRMVKDGKFPEPIRWNRQFVRWKRTAVDEAIRNR
jgi:excisionase family DNA binding protein